MQDLSTGISDITIFVNKVFEEVNKFKRRPYQIWEGTNLMTGIFIRKRSGRQRQTHKKDSQVKTGRN